MPDLNHMQSLSETKVSIQATASGCEFFLNVGNFSGAVLSFGGDRRAHQVAQRQPDLRFVLSLTAPEQKGNNRMARRMKPDSRSVSAWEQASLRQRSAVLIYRL